MKQLFAKFQPMILLPLIVIAIIGELTLADLNEEPMLLSESDLRSLSIEDQEMVLQAMEKDLNDLTEAKRPPVQIQLTGGPTFENLMINYSLFKDYCISLNSKNKQYQNEKECAASLEVSTDLLEKAFRRHAEKESRGEWWSSKNTPTMEEVIEQDFPNKSNGDPEPRIWSYATWNKYVPGNGMGWKTIEGYVCTQDDPLNLREGKGSDSAVIDQMPPMSPIIMYNFVPFEDWTYVQYGDTQGFAHTSFICMGNAREDVFSEKDQQKDHSKNSPDFYNYAPGSKCDHRQHPNQFVGPAGGNRKLWLDVCNEAKGTTPRWCMDMTCPNLSEKSRFQSLYGKSAPRQLIPSAQQFGVGIELVRYVTRFEKAGLCIDRINNWHRPKKYNAKVDGKKSSYHMVQGGAKAIDILFCNHRDQKKAAKLMDQWHGGMFKGGIGIYKNTATLHIDLRGYAARW